VKTTTTPRIAKGAHPSFFADPATDAMYGMLIVLLEEICVLRDRLDTYERLGHLGITVTPGSVNDFAPDGETEALREKRRQGTISRVMRPVKALQEAAVQQANSRYKHMAQHIAEQDL
jgi:hypothetical protein